jgi:hypothetical protein
MPFRSILEGESKLFGFLGANATLGGLQVAITTKLQSLMPCINNLLSLAQLAVAVATFIYIVLKIRKVLRDRKE